MRREALVVASELRTQYQRLRGLLKKHERFTLTAPFSGVVVDQIQQLRVGEWLGEGAFVFALLDSDTHGLNAYIAEADLARARIGAKAKFYPEQGRWDPMEVIITEIHPTAIRTLERLYPASLLGGDLAVRENEENKLVPVSGFYRMRLEILNMPFSAQRVIRGTVVFPGEPMSFFARVKRHVYASFRRESGF